LDSKQGFVYNDLHHICQLQNNILDLEEGLVQMIDQEHQWKLKIFEAIEMFKNFLS
jgi:hypothetical protein